MPGTYIFKPIEANLTHDTDLIGKMNPYCAFNVGGTKIKSQVCRKGGKHPHWSDAIIIPIADEALYSQITVQLMDKETILSDDTIGDFMLDLKEVQDNGQLRKWYAVSYNDEPAGEILMEATYKSGFNVLDDQGKLQPNEEVKPSDLSNNSSIDSSLQPPPTVITEQKQIVQPHTFVKEVEVVETRPTTREIEVMEPVKVIKQVQVTEPVTVTKLVEITEPEVVLKEIEVMEKRLVTKTIQVIEDVPVIRQVEVVEMKTTYQEVETVESRTFEREVEVIEYQPVKKEVEVTEPVTIKKAVEYVEPVMTTVTITKAIPQPVIVGEEVAVEVGPATVINKQVAPAVETKLMKTEMIGLESEKEMLGSEKPMMVTIEEEKIVIESADGTEVEGKLTVVTKEPLEGVALLE